MGDVRTIVIDDPLPHSSSSSSRKKKPRAPPRQAKEKLLPRPPAGQSYQDTLTEETFAEYLDGFEPVDLGDLLALRGGRMRYVIETLDADGEIVDRKYRLGGVLIKVDPGLRYLRLFNPFVRMSWSVQLQEPGKRVRLYHMAPATGAEIALLRKLLKQLEAGDIVIKRVQR